MVERDFTRLTEAEKQKIESLAQAIRSKYDAGDVRESIALAFEMLSRGTDTDNILKGNEIALTFNKTINLLDWESLENGGYYQVGDGSFVSDVNWKSTPLIPIEIDTYYSKNSSGQNITYWAEDGSYVSGVNNPGSQSFKTQNTNGIKYVRYNIHVNDPVSMFVRGNKYPEEYIPYQIPVLSPNVQLKDRDATILKYVSNNSKNLVDPNKIVGGGYYKWDSGEFIHTTNNNYKTTDFIEVKADTYYVKTINSQIAYWDENRKYITGEDSGKLFKTPNDSNIKYMTSSIVNGENFMILEGLKLPSAYIPYIESFKFEENYTLSNVTDIDPKELRHVESTTEPNANYLDLDNIEPGCYYHYQTGNRIKSYANSTSNLIPVTPGETITKPPLATEANQVTFWDASGNFISGLDTLGKSSFNVPNNPAITGLKVTIQNNMISDAMIVKSSTYPSRYVPYLETPVYKLPKEYFDIELRKGAVTEYSLSQEVKDMISGSSNRDYLKPFGRVVNPILTKDIVTDRDGVTGVADPFIVQEDGRYHLFFEVIHSKTQEIGHAYSDDLENWTYTQIILAKDSADVGHRSAYPNTFKWEGDWYMMPDTTGDLRLYKATSFPLEWEYVTTLMTGVFYDTNIFEMDNVFYMFSSAGLKLYYNESGDWRNSNWVAHPFGQLLPEDTTASAYRCGGSIEKYDGYITIPVQVTPKASGVYGEYTYLIKVGNLSKTDVRVTNLGILTEAQFNDDWNHKSMHHVSHSEYLKRNIYAADGQYSNGDYAIGLYLDI